MKIYKSQNEVIADIKDGVLVVNEDVRFECSISIEAKIIVKGNIDAEDITAVDIDAEDITAWNIDAWDIDAGNINARNIDAGNIDAWDINAGNINARDINAGDIDAGDIKYYAACLAYQNIACTSITAKRNKHCDPVCLDGKLTIKPKEDMEIKVGSFVKTIKGDRLRTDAKDEKLEVLKVGKVRTNCRCSSDGRISSFLNKNLVPYN